MAVAFAMIASFLASQTFVPILANWMMKNKHNKKARARGKRAFFEKFRLTYSYRMRRRPAKPFLLFAAYVILAGGIVGVLLTVVGTDVMPVSNNGDFQMRIQAPQGSRIEKTETIVKAITEDIKTLVPEDGINMTSAFVGMHPAGSPINPIFLFSSASHESVLQVSVNQDVYSGSMEDLKESIRNRIAEKY